MISITLINDIEDEFQKDAEIEEIMYEGSEIIIYTRNKQFFKESLPFVRKLVGKYKKRIEMRADKTILADEEETKETINKLVPKDAGIRDIYFEPEFAKVVIHAEKPGLVIGKSGETLISIKEKTFWTPDIKRAPMIDSEVIKSIRKMLHKDAANRKKFLHKLGEKIYTPGKEVDWIRMSCLGAFRDIGRSCVLVQTPESRVMLDCGVSAGSTQHPFPYLEAPEFNIQDLDAVVVSHAHIDHCLHPESLVQMSDGEIVQIKDAATGRTLPSIDFGDTLQTENMPSIQRGAIPAPEKLHEIRTKTKRLKVTGEHPFFSLHKGRIMLVQARDINEGDYIASAKSFNIKGKLQKLPLSSKFPETPNEEIMQLIGYLIGDGTKMGRNYGCVCATDKDIDNLQKYADILKNLGLSPRIEQRERNRLKVYDVNFRRWLEKIESSMLSLSPIRRVPSLICKSPKTHIAAFLKGLYDAEGSVKHHSIVFCTSSERLVHEVQILLQRFNIISHIYDQDQSTSTFGGGSAFQLAISYPQSLATFREEIGFSDLRKVKKLNDVVERSGNAVSSKIDLIPVSADAILETAGKLGLRKIDVRRLGFAYTHYYKHFPSRSKILEITNKLAEIARKKRKTLHELDLLQKIAQSDILWEPVVSNKKIKSDCKEVYDLTVPGHSNYIANGIIVHNCGFVPYLYEYGYTGPVYCTRPTRDLMSLMQLDIIQIAQRENKKPPYTSKGIEREIKHCITLEYGEVTDIAPDMRLTLQNAGHLLGSSTVHLNIGNGLYNLLYTGDIKFENTLLFDRTSCDYTRVEGLIIESTYGSNQDRMPDHRDGERQLVEIVKKTIDRGGRVLIPAFATGRGQDVIAILTKTDIQVPIYLDGMVWDASAIHTAYPEFMSKYMQTKILHKGENPFLDSRLKGIGSGKERREVLDSKHPAVVISTSGMLIGGPAIEYLENFAEDPKNMLAFVGYQHDGTLGKRIQKGWKQVQLENGRSFELKLEIDTVSGLGGHSDFDQILSFIRQLKTKPKKIIVNHGPNDRSLELARQIHQQYRIETVAPKILDAIRLR